MDARRTRALAIAKFVTVAFPWAMTRKRRSAAGDACEAERCWVEFLAQIIFKPWRNRTSIVNSLFPVCASERLDGRENNDADHQQRRYFVDDAEEFFAVAVAVLGEVAAPPPHH